MVCLFFTIALPRNKLDRFLEEKVNAFLAKADTAKEAGYVHIRVLSSTKQVVKVKAATKAK